MPRQSSGTTIPDQRDALTLGETRDFGKVEYPVMAQIVTRAGKDVNAELANRACTQHIRT
jgi:hypothetical protein